MTLALIIYLAFTALPAIAEITMGVFVVWALVSLMGLFVGALNRDCYNKRETWDGTLNSVVKGWYKLAVVCLCISLLTPSKEVTAYMIGAYGVQTIAENDKVQELGSEGLDVLQALMKKAKNSLEIETVEKEGVK